MLYHFTITSWCFKMIWVTFNINWKSKTYLTYLRHSTLHFSYNFILTSILWPPQVWEVCGRIKLALRTMLRSLNQKSQPLPLRVTGIKKNIISFPFFSNLKYLYSPWKSCNVLLLLYMNFYSQILIRIRISHCLLSKRNSQHSLWSN